MLKQGLLCVAALAALGAAVADAGIISYTAINNDADCGISTANTYVVKVGFWTASETVNGVTFDPLTPTSGTTATASGLAMSVANGVIQQLDNSFNNPIADGQQLKGLLNTFAYNNSASTGAQQSYAFATTDLVAGTTYDERIYIHAWVPGGNRVQSFAFTGDGATSTIASLNEDNSISALGGSNNNQAYYINYRFTWDGITNPSVVITPTDPSSGFHAYAMSIQVVPEPVAMGVVGLGAILGLQRRRLA